MLLRHLDIYDFKNYEEIHLDFSHGSHVFIGPNGSGKTNLLDAIYYLGFTRSAFATTDGQNIRYGQAQFLIKSRWLIDDREMELACAIQNGKKIMRENDIDYPRMADHIGKYPVVLICPDDSELVTGASEVRRKFFDSLLSQVHHVYLDQLIRYTYFLKQRNALLQMAVAQNRAPDMALLDQYENELTASADTLIPHREELLHRFNIQLQEHYAFLAGPGSELPEIFYESNCSIKDLRQRLRRDLPADLAAQRTTSGPHRDKFVFKLGGRELRKFGSQGQQKSFIVGLKLAEFQLLERPGIKPLLLLDDIFDKLDDQRVSKLMELAEHDLFGQVFITDASPIRALRVFEQSKLTPRLYQVNEGQVQQVEDARVLAGIESMVAKP